MPRANRYFIGGYAYHLTHRCHNRQFLLRFGSDRNAYRKTLRDALLESDVSLLDYCLTSNHVHLLTYAEEVDQISTLMQKVQGVFAQAYNRRNDRSGAFWSDRFHATMIEPGRHLEECLVYIVLNMYRCGAVDHPRDWRWCGYDELMGLRQRYRVLDMEQLMRLVGGVDVAQFRQNYTAMIERKIAEGRLAKESRWTESIAVGTEEFVRRVASRIRGRQQLEVVALDHGWILREAVIPYRADFDSCGASVPMNGSRLVSANGGG